jgi:TrmH family RNA methyltransferase
VEAIYYSPERLKSEYAIRLIEGQSAVGIACYAVAAAAFESLADKENPQGILAVVRQPERKLTDLNPSNFPWGVALAAPQDPGNLGAILRTIDAVGASGLILLDSSVDLYHPSAVRASMGTIFWRPAVQTSFTEFQAWALQHGYHIYGSSAHGESDYRQGGAYLRPRILLLGQLAQPGGGSRRAAIRHAGGGIVRSAGSPGCQAPTSEGSWLISNAGQKSPPLTAPALSGAARSSRPPPA